MDYSKTIGVLNAHGKHHRISEDDVRIVHDAPRLLVIEVDLGGIKLALFGAHCPHSGQRQDAADFLQNLYSMLRPLRRSHLVLGGIDLNGRPELQTPSTTGNLEYGETDQTGRAASDLFQRLQCWLPSTYSRYHPGESRTFCHPTGASHRIDFVVVSGKARIEQVLSKVHLDVDVGSARDDHFPVCCSLFGSIGQRGELRI